MIIQLENVIKTEILSAMLKMYVKVSCKVCLKCIEIHSKRCPRYIDNNYYFAIIIIQIVYVLK